jgi:hypothetical protein
VIDIAHGAAAALRITSAQQVNNTIDPKRLRMLSVPLS